MIDLLARVTAFSRGGRRTPVVPAVVLVVGLGVLGLTAGPTVAQDRPTTTLDGSDETVEDRPGTPPELPPARAPSDLLTRVSPENFADLRTSSSNGAFQVGERLVLRVTYLGITAGYITIGVGEDRVDDRRIYTLLMRARTAGTVDWIYSVRDTLVSYMDVEGLFSWGYDYRQDHDGEKETTQIRYDQEQGFVVEDGERGDSVPRYTQDILSAVYYLRTQDLKVGQAYSFPVHVSDNYYHLVMRVDGVEKIATFDGWKEAYRLIPDVRSRKKTKDLKEHVYSNKEGGVQLWVSRDERKVPLMVALPARFGTFYGYLESYHPR